MASENSSSANLDVAAKWISDADVVLVCAGAGMSATEGEAVYVLPEDFTKHYPFMNQYGYSTGYECMGLIGDRRVPNEVKWAYFASHYSNLRWNFKPNAGYDTLKRLIGDRDYFVLTSNVDACFERAGFDPEKIYTPQGDAAYYQCLRCCRPNAVFESKPLFDKLLGSNDVLEKGFVDPKLVPCCPHCGGPVFMNLRGGGWFLHHKYDDQNLKFMEWVDSNLKSGKRIVVIEVGVGFNTPVITRYPVESIIREATTMTKEEKEQAAANSVPLNRLSSSLIRINPAACETPPDLAHCSMGLKAGWEILNQIEQIVVSSQDSDTISVADAVVSNGSIAPVSVANDLGDWRQLISRLHSLK